jgi:hypothetical protein
MTEPTKYMNYNSLFKLDDFWKEVRGIVKDKKNKESRQLFPARLVRAYKSDWYHQVEDQLSYEATKFIEFMFEMDQVGHGRNPFQYSSQCQMTQLEMDQISIRYSYNSDVVSLDKINEQNILVFVYERATHNPLIIIPTSVALNYYNALVLDSRDKFHFQNQNWTWYQKDFQTKWRSLHSFALKPDRAEVINRKLKRALRFQEEQFISASKIRDFVSKINEISSDLNEGRFSRNSLDGLYDSFQRVYSDLQTLKSFHWKLVGNTPEETEEKLRAAIAGESFKKKKKPKPEA